VIGKRERASVVSPSRTGGPPFAVASRNGDVGIGAAIQILNDGGSALDAVEAGIRVVESNEKDTSVGRGGLPNVLGQVELDASIMDGATRAAGAVGAVHDYEHVITLARRVMEDLPHTTLVGPGAEQFAAGLGMVRTSLLTDDARRLWHAHLRERLGDEQAVRDLLALGGTADHDHSADLVGRLLDPTRNTGTVNFIACDERGDIASGVSTSGWESKYPGRLGDTPVIGAGNYADNRFGAATCTGHGELTTRCGTARSVVRCLQLGMSVGDAMTEAALDTAALNEPYSGGVEILAVDRSGNVGAIATAPVEKDDTHFFVYQSTDMPAFEIRPRMTLTGA
jgi:L-asparaginase / beta-aspartyl-peptidase